MTDQLLTTAQVAERFGVKPSRVRQLAILHGVGRKFGRDLLFTPADMQRIESTWETINRRRSFLIEPGDDHDAFTVRAQNYQHAAEIAARRMYGRRNISVLRSSGNTDYAGRFHAYRYDRRVSASLSVGSGFHVSEA